MANVIQYRNYHAKIEYSAEDNMLIGSVINIQDSLNFHGSSIEEITQAFHDSVDNYLELCKMLGKTPEKAYKGSLNIRIPQELHRRAAIMAETEGISLNQLIQSAIEERVHPPKYKSTVTILPPICENQMLQIHPALYTTSQYRTKASATMS